MVCVDFNAPQNSISETSFQERIFQETGRNVTVIFNVWEGIQEGNSPSRVSLSETVCGGCLNRIARLKYSDTLPALGITYLPADSSHQAVVPSARIAGLIDQFLSKYLSGERYIAVMLRTEKLYKNQSVFSVPPERNTCAGGILSDWRDLSRERHINKTLFFSDIGAHGSLRWSNSDAASFSKYIHDSVRVSLTLDEVNSVLEEMTGSEDSVTIAVLQQQLVARATCVVVVGGGTFQMNMYAHGHRGRECSAVRNFQCSRAYISHVHGY